MERDKFCVEKELWRIGPPKGLGKTKPISTAASRDTAGLLKVGKYW
jgi:hypothetical protein